MVALVSVAFGARHCAAIFFVIDPTVTGAAFAIWHSHSGAVARFAFPIFDAFPHLTVPQR